MASPGTALVVGASSAIGGAVAAALTADGHDCLLWGRHRDRLAAAGPHGHPVDLRAPAEVQAALAELPGRLSAVVYAAGLFDWAPADDGDPDVCDELLTVNLTAAMRVTRGVLPALLAGAPSSLVLLQPADVADAVRWVVGTPPHVCPVEVELQPQRTPG